jgi:putative membrane protein
MSNQEESNRLRRIVGWGIVGLIAVIGVLIALPYLTSRPAEVFYYYPFFSFRFGWIGGILLIFIVFWVARWFLWPWRGGGYYSYRYPQRDAESIVKERYAKGEITKEQFEQMMRDLERKI